MRRDITIRTKSDFDFVRIFFCWRLLGLIPGGTPFSQLNKGVRDAMSETTKTDFDFVRRQPAVSGVRDVQVITW